jgi:hypothetical protein
MDDETKKRVDEMWDRLGIDLAVDRPAGRAVTDQRARGAGS